MQFDLQADGSRIPLPAPSVDTGAGLERIAAVMQGVPSNFDTDLFTPIIHRAVEVVGLPYDRGPAGAPYRVLADHARAVAFLLADGVFPSSDGRGYVLRRILRRAVRYAWLLGQRQPTLVHLTGRVVDLMRGVYPDLDAKRAHIERTTRAEEERFLETIEGGSKRLDELKGAKVIGGDEAFKLYDTYGFPLDLTQLIAAERGQTVDAGGRSAVVGTFGERFEPTPAEAVVNEARRRNIERNHTATHLVHAALRKVLGAHVRQMGSVVAPDRLRFDFAHHGPVGDIDLAAVEEEVNAHIWENLPVATREMKYKDAIAAGAMAFFTEKYGDIVRVVDVPGVSLELCGGTHVATSGQIGLFRFTHETGAAANVRRIEAITGPAAYREARELERRLAEAAGLLKAQPEHLARRIEALVEENKKLERRVGELLKGGGGTGEGGSVEQIGDVAVHLQESDLDDRDQIGLVVDAFRAKHKRAILVLLTKGSRPGVHVAVTDDLVSAGLKAGEIAGDLAAKVGGKGGGRPHFASAGIGDVGKFPLLKSSTGGIIRKRLEG